MFINITFLWKGFGTPTTLIWFLIWVWLHVSLKVTFIWKRFGTPTTLTWFLARMRPHESLKFTLFWKSLITLTTFVQSLLRCILLLTTILICAWIGFLSIFLFSENDVEQLLHWYGFSPKCVLICIWRVLLSEKVLSHWLHLCGLSSIVFCF